MDCSASLAVSNFEKHINPSSPPILSQQLEDCSNPKHRTDPNGIVQNFLLIWLDEKIDPSSADYCNSIKQLRQVVNTIETFRKAD
ncbi:unnamed protein product [Rotaria sp. Silwood2]|nr:unnamed protein product [Rotaria sp. Silwood2]CAF3150295.1 unnamed protein product [Rotaria sp. Silwood2]CAF3353794.1 unnamed protein product [Rotaria sp. Silwood2]CAF3451863.1 unnamed protein product [Rotaria sp. Silwood2]CAF4483591.1 unnamed protein product [Rotaria sp. Silwood2]